MQVAGDLTPGTMGQDNDVDGDTIFVSQFVVNGMTVTVDRMTGGSITLSEGTLTINADGSFTFDPVGNFNGNVPEVTYTIVDDNGGSDTATLNIAIGALNDAPVAEDDGPFDVMEDTPTMGNVLTNGTADSDPDGDMIEVTSFTVAGLAGSFMAGETAMIPNVGTLVINDDGSFTFTPAANYNGPVPTATYTISDGNGGTDTAMLSFNDVSAVND
ncbi:MAG: Ig-like domain-containing protein, partial [Pseudomonadota bacterium]